jgi:hypothetical protein
VLELRVGPVVLRRASAEDLDSIMTLLSDDPVSASRGDVASETDRPTYLLALQQVVADPANVALTPLGGHLTRENVHHGKDTSGVHS